MNKICSKCGGERDVKEFYVYHRTAGFPDIKQPCRECRKIKSREHYSYHPEKKSEQNRISRLKYIKRYRKTANKRHREYTKEIADLYVKQLYCQSGIKAEAISLYPELIELKRAQIKLKRLTDEKCNRPKKRLA